MYIRPLVHTDIAAVARLLATLTDEFIAHESAPDCAAAFKRQHNEDAIRSFVATGMVYYVAELGGSVAGFIALRDNQHVFHLFVDQAHHRKGIARALWQVAREAAVKAGNAGVFTVNSSNYALPAYQSMGFERTDVMQFKDGIYYNPMQLNGRPGD